jgi:hypothetical protein
MPFVLTRKLRQKLQNYPKNRIKCKKSYLSGKETNAARAAPPTAKLAETTRPDFFVLAGTENLQPSGRENGMALLSQQGHSVR